MASKGAMETGKDSVQTLSIQSSKTHLHPSITLDKLPAEIQRLIYVNLLEADYVCQPPNEYLVRSYHFHTAILFANKRINEIAHPILYHENHFVLVSCNFDKIFEDMEKHGVAAVSKKRNLVARFKHHSMRVHVVFPWAEPQLYEADILIHNKSTILRSFVTLRNELYRFVSLLQILSLSKYDCARSTSLTLRIEGQAAGTPHLGLQKLLLEPFRRLSILNYRATVFGSVDAAYGKNLLDDIMVQIQWTRGTAWHIYAILVSIIKTAEEALGQRRFHVAFTMYRECRKLHGHACEKNPRISHLEDTGFYLSRLMLLAVCDTNMTLLKLKLPYLPGTTNSSWLLHQTDWIEDLIREQCCQPVLFFAKCLMYHYSGISKASMGNDHAALGDFSKAAGFGYDNRVLKRHIAIVKKRIAATSAAERLAAGIVSADILPLKVLRLAAPKYSPSENIASERCVLRQLGYKGDMLPQIAEAKPADSKTMDKILDNVKKQKECVVLPFGEIFPIWVDTEDNPYITSGGSLT
ncbi:MAG: hypothetical protein Q9225_006887, partial [Loekoesia sp. 1 TL-2023]